MDTTVEGENQLLENCSVISTSAMACVYWCYVHVHVHKYTHTLTNNKPSTSRSMISSLSFRTDRAIQRDLVSNNDKKIQNKKKQQQQKFP